MRLLKYAQLLPLKKTVTEPDLNLFYRKKNQTMRSYDTNKTLTSKVDSTEKF